MTRGPARVAAVPGAVAGAAVGATLGAMFGVAALVRRTKPLHPVGRVGSGVLTVTDPLPGLGVPLLAEARSTSCLVRWSRAVGLPAPLPDVQGIALRFDDPTADLLLAGTGSGPVGRFVLRPRAPDADGALTTLLPVACDRGPLVFGLTPEPGSGTPPSRLSLSVAIGGAAWASVGTLECVWGPDRPLRFDPVEHVLPGTAQYRVVRLVREPAYAMARRGASARA